MKKERKKERNEQYVLPLSLTKKKKKKKKKSSLAISGGDALEKCFINLLLFSLLPSPFSHSYIFMVDSVCIWIATRTEREL